MTFSTFYPPIFKNVKINQFKIVDIKIKLFESASFTVLLYDTDNNLCDSKFYELPTDAYLQWYNEDVWLVKWVKNKLQNEGQNDGYNDFVSNS
jgi:hypothetical protein